MPALRLAEHSIPVNASLDDSNFTDDRLRKTGRGHKGSYGRGGDAIGSTIRQPRAACLR